MKIIRLVQGEIALRKENTTAKMQRIGSGDQKIQFFLLVNLTRFYSQGLALS